MTRTPQRKPGKTIIPFGVFPELHELETAAVFLEQGYDVEFVVPSRTKGSKTPDVKMDGILWEIKSPTGHGKKTVEKQLQRAGKQSKNIILDGRRSKLEDDMFVKELHKKFALVRSIKRIIFIRKNKQVVDFRR